MLANANSLQLASFHHSVEEYLVEDKHVSVSWSDLLDPLNFDFVGCGVSWELDIDLRQVRQVGHRVEAVSVDYKDLELLS